MRLRICKTLHAQLKGCMGYWTSAVHELLKPWEVCTVVEAAEKELVDNHRQALVHGEVLQHHPKPHQHVGVQYKPHRDEAYPVRTACHKKTPHDSAKSGYTMHQMPNSVKSQCVLKAHKNKDLTG